MHQQFNIPLCANRKPGLHIETTPYLCTEAVIFYYKIEMKCTVSLAGYVACRKVEGDDFLILPFRGLLANCRLHCAEGPFTFPLLIFALL